MRINLAIFIFSLTLAFLMSSCSSRRSLVKRYNSNKTNKVVKKEEKKSDVKVVVKKTEKKMLPPSSNPIMEAESKADFAGRKILETGRKMALVDKTIVKGSCWDYIHTVYTKAGYWNSKKVIFKSVKTGPYADVSMIKPGDWIYHVNYSYHNVGHSGIFVYWKDYKNKIGVTLSYGGEKRNEPGRYKTYDLKSVYYIARPVSK